MNPVKKFVTLASQSVLTTRNTGNFALNSLPQIQTVGVLGPTAGSRRSPDPLPDSKGSSFEDHVSNSDERPDDIWTDDGERDAVQEVGNTEAEMGPDEKASMDGLDITAPQEEGEPHSSVVKSEFAITAPSSGSILRSDPTAPHSVSELGRRSPTHSVGSEGPPSTSGSKGSPVSGTETSGGVDTGQRPRRSPPEVAAETAPRTGRSQQAGNAENGSQRLLPPHLAFSRQATGASLAWEHGSAPADKTYTNGVSGAILDAPDLMEQVLQPRIGGPPTGQNSGLDRNIVLSGQRVTESVDLGETALRHRKQGNTNTNPPTGGLVRVGRSLAASLTSLQPRGELQLTAPAYRSGEGMSSDFPHLGSGLSIGDSAMAQGTSATIAQFKNLFSGSSVGGATRLDMAQPVIPQIVDAIGKSGNGTILVALNPQELGQVRMSVTASESGFVVSILAERAETLEIMRRHSETLMDELRRFGFEDVDLEFSQGRSGFSPSSERGNTLENFDIEADQLPLAVQPRYRQSCGSNGLDIRI